MPPTDWRKALFGRHQDQAAAAAAAGAPDAAAGAPEAPVGAPDAAPPVPGAPQSILVDAAELVPHLVDELGARFPHLATDAAGLAEHLAALLPAPGVVEPLVKSLVGPLAQAFLDELDRRTAAPPAKAGA